MRKIVRHRFSFACTLTLVLAIGLVADARAGIITPPGLKPGSEFRIIFVTATLTDASSKNLTQYDTIVRGDALAGGLGTYGVSPVSWEAIASTDTVNAISRLPADNVPIFLPDGTEVASSGAAFWGGANVQLQHAIDETATGAPVGLFNATWTGSRPNGTEASIPNDKGLGDTIVAAGFAGATDSTWVHVSDTPQSFDYALYGFSDVLTVPGQVTMVPEPGCLSLAFVGIAAFASAHLTRRRRGTSCRPALQS